MKKLCFLVFACCQFTLIYSQTKTGTNHIQSNLENIFPSPQKISSNCTGKKIYITKGSDNGKYIDANNFNYSPGDTFVLKSNQNPYSYFSLESIHGTATCPVTIINEGGQVFLQNGMAFNNCSYIKISGTGSSDTYGFKIEDPINGGVAIDVSGRSKNIEINNFYIHDKTYGFWVKQEASCIDSLQFPHWVIDSVFLHDNLIKNIGQEGMYLGSTDPNGTRAITCNGKTIYPKPLRLGDIKILNNIIDSTNRSGIQLSSASVGNNLIKNNQVTNCGFSYDPAQGNGIVLGGYTHARISNNQINNTFSMGIFSLGSGKIFISDNTIDNSGRLNGHTWNGMASIMIDTRITSPADSIIVTIKNNNLGSSTDCNVRVYDTYPTYEKGNIICGNTYKGSGNASVCVANGIDWHNCSGLNFADVGGKDFSSDLSQKTITSEKSLSTVLFPNPVKNFLNVKLNSDMTGKISLNIYNEQGKLMQTNSGYNFASSTQTLNVATLSAGFYILEIVGENKTAILKFIKED